MKNRLKLYDTSIEIVINKKTKEKLRKIAFKEKVTMSEYLRRVIDFIIISNEIDKKDNELMNTLKDFNKISKLIGDNNKEE